MNYIEHAQKGRAWDALKTTALLDALDEIDVAKFSEPYDLCYDRAIEAIRVEIKKRLGISEYRLVVNP